MKKISIVSFSSHENGNCERIATFIQKQIKAQVEVLRMSQLELHGCGRCLYECFDDTRTCPYVHDGVAKIYRQVAASDFCIMLIPNYSGTPCANYFIFKERSQCIWSIPMDKVSLWEAYISTPKHFLVIANTCHEVFTSLLTNEIADGEKLHLTFISSHETKSKSTKGDLIENTYYQNLVLNMLKEENLI